MASGAKTLEIIQRDNLTLNANQRGKQLRNLSPAIQIESDCIAENRGRGVAISIDSTSSAEKRPNNQKQVAVKVQFYALYHH